MKAEELVIRYWALSEGIRAYEKPLATFISKYAEVNRNLTEDELKKLSSGIRHAHGYAVELFGPHCFSFSKDGASRFNAAVFDAQMVACSKLTAATFQTLRDQQGNVRKAYEKLQ
jgi:hypothetical protein